MKKQIIEVFLGLAVVLQLSLISSNKSKENIAFKHKTVQELQIDKSGHFLITSDGRPFFWLGDTAWPLFSKLNEDEVTKYFKDRKAKNFNVIQAQVIDWNIGKANAYGHLPFIDENISTPNELYWKHADYIIEKASKMGLYIALLPAWGATHVENKRNSLGSLELSPEEAFAYGKFLGTRFKKYKNIVWVLGGDVKPVKHAVYHSMVVGITKGYGEGNEEKILMTYHPPGGTYRPPATSSGEFYHNKSWMDFNMIQSGHNLGNKNYERIFEDYQRNPIKPTFDSEPCYEGHPIKHKFENGVFTAWHLRRRAYWSVLAGGFGFTYGANAVWQMDKPGDIHKESHHNGFWYDALNLDGASDMTHVRNLFESRPFTNPLRLPDQNLIKSLQGTVNDRVQAATASDSTYAIVYITNGSTFELDLSKIAGEGINCWWYNPRDGKVYDSLGKPKNRPFVTLSTKDTYQFDPPGKAAEENDWVLILDDTSKNYKTPEN